MFENELDRIIDTQVEVSKKVRTSGLLQERADFLYSYYQALKKNFAQDLAQEILIAEIRTGKMGIELDMGRL